MHVNKSQLADIIGVTERSINDWQKEHMAIAAIGGIGKICDAGAVCAKVIYLAIGINMNGEIEVRRGSFPNEESVMSVFYLALQNFSKKWTMPFVIENLR